MPYSRGFLFQIEGSSTRTPGAGVGVLAAGDEDAAVRHQRGRRVPAVRQQPVRRITAGVLRIKY